MKGLQSMREGPNVVGEIRKMNTYGERIVANPWVYKIIT